MHETRPRQYATEALKKETKAEAWEYVQNSVPKKYQEWVVTYLRMWWPKRKEVLESVRKVKERQAYISR